LLLQQNDESIAADLEEDTFILDSVRALLNYLFMSALKRHEVIATTSTKKIDTLIAEQKEHVARALKKAVTELYLDAQKKVAALYVEAEKQSGKHLIKHSNKISPCHTHNYFPPLSLSQISVRWSRRIIWNFMESYNIVEPGNDLSNMYSKFSLTKADFWIP
jgi:hypothetical protein